MKKYILKRKKNKNQIFDKIFDIYFFIYYITMINIFLIPSMYAHFLSGFLILLATILVILHWKDFLYKSRVSTIIVLLLFFSIAIGIHGLSHLGLENTYNFNPIQKMINSDNNRIQ
jgi:hypothetical protein